MLSEADLLREDAATGFDLEVLDRLNDEGEVLPGLVTSYEALQAAICVHPGLQWKAVNIRKLHESG